MARRLSDRDWLSQKLKHLYPDEDMYHTLFRDGEYRTLERLLKTRLEGSDEEIKKIEAIKRKLKENKTLTRLYEQRGKIERFLKDLASLMSSKQQP